MKPRLDATVDDDTPAQPSWRGLSHELAIGPSAVATVWLVVAADSGLAAVAVAVHGATLVTLLVTSAVYHRHCRRPETKRAARRADHAAIFMLIAGSYTPLCLLAVPRPVGIPVLTVVWLLAMRFGGLKLKHLQLGQDRFHSWMYAALGWAGVILVPWMIAGIGWYRLGFIVLGGLAYTAGGLVLINKSPNPSPTRFGYHEIWHVGVLIGATLHFWVSASLT